MRARDIMTTVVVTVGPETTVKAAAALLAGRGFTALPVVDDDEVLVGIVTEADLIQQRIPPDPRVRGRDTVPRATGGGVAEVMSSPVLAAGPGADLTELTAALVKARHRSVPIVEGGRLVGIITRRDLLGVLARSDSDIARDVRHRLEIYGGLGRWSVQVRDGVVSVADDYHDATDDHVAVVLAEAVPGVVRAVVSGPGG